MRWSAMRFSSTSRRTVSSSISSIFATSWEVLNPSKKCRNGTRDSIVAKCATRAMSWACCTSEAPSSANPVCLAAITSE